MARFTSRKFLAALGAVLISLGTIASGRTDSDTISGAVLAVIGLVGYMFSEAYVDAAGARARGQVAAAAATATTPASAQQATAAAVDTAAGLAAGAQQNGQQ